jgi:tRNA(Arg) A34 adenosine deaminase TadA
MNRKTYTGDIVILLMISNIAKYEKVKKEEMESVVALAKEVAQGSAMEKRLGCVILHKKRVIALSPNYTVGTPINNAGVHNVSMHSEMGAIEQLAKKMGFLQSLHHVLAGRRVVKCRWRTSKVYFEGGSGRC